jgi:hypothetical protein
VLVSEGTAVAGRILSIRKYYEPSRAQVSDVRRTGPRAPSLVIHVRLETLEVGGTPQPLKATFDTGLRRFVKQTSPFAVRVDIGSLNELHDRSNDSDTGTFEFWEPDPNHVVKSGLESNWLTAAR